MIILYLTMGSWLVPEVMWIRGRTFLVWRGQYGLLSTSSKIGLIFKPPCGYMELHI